MADGQRLHQAVSNGLHHLIRICLRIQFTGKLNQRAAVVVTVAIKITVQTFLYPVANRLKQESSHQHDRDQTRPGQVFDVALGQTAQ